MVGARVRVRLLVGVGVTVRRFRIELCLGLVLGL